jgi:hypothetical protein
MEELSLQQIENDTRDIQESNSKQSAQAEIYGAIVLAKRFPRSEEEARSKLSISLGRIGFAEKAQYSYPRGGKAVTGPSVYLAREIARCWGNIRHGVTIIHDDEKSRTVEGWAWDIETNTKATSQSTFSKKIQRKNNGVTAWVTPDERDLRELTNKHGAICVRNSILQLLPADLIDDCKIQSMNTIKKGINTQNIIQVRADTLTAFEKSFGLTKTELEEYIGIPCENWSSEEIASLRVIFSSLKEGELKKSEMIIKKDKPSSQKEETETEKQFKLQQESEAKK